MAIDRGKFFDAVRPKLFAGHISTAQFDGLTRILDEWERRKLTDSRWLAYMLATAYHETGHMLQPVRESGGEAYLRSKDYYPWVGEGLVQVTWEANHRKFGATAPGQLLTWPIALRALFDGMIKGMFTNKKLADYFSGARADWVGARAIVNGSDRAALIAGYGQSFYAAIRAAETGAAPAKTVSPATTAGAGAIVAGTVATAGGSQWIHAGTTITIAVIVGGFVLLLLLAWIASLKAPGKITAAAAPGLPPAPVAQITVAPAAIPTSGSALSAALDGLAAAGGSWDSAIELVAKIRAEELARARAILAADAHAEERVAAIKASPEPSAAPAPVAESANPSPIAPQPEPAPQGAPA